MLIYSKKEAGLEIIHMRPNDEDQTDILQDFCRNPNPVSIEWKDNGPDGFYEMLLKKRYP
jgi:hypothetical protein